MNLATITTKLSTVGGPKAQLLVGKAAKYSPQILTGVGVISGIASTYLVARATLKLEPLMDNHELGKKTIQEKVDDGLYLDDSERAKDVRRLFMQTSVDLIKLYGPGISVGVGGVVCVIAAQGIQQQRQVALVAAVKSVESAFQAYRQRVIDSIGAEKEADIRYGIKTETIEEDGKKTKVRSYDIDPELHMAFFDESNKNWQRGNRELNLLFLKNMESWCNDRLTARGYLYLNEVLDWLGLPQSPAGQIVGWLHKDFNNGDGYVSFGWENPVNAGNVKRFINGDEDGILLDFNVDGEIMSKL